MTTAPSEGATAVERVSWPEFLERFSWHQGDHMTLVGPTKRGKTTLALELIEKAFPAPWQVVLVTKARDPLLDELKGKGYARLPRWIVSDPGVYPKVALAPPLRKGVRSKGEQREAFQTALESIFRQGGWLVYADELRYITETLGLGEDMEVLWQQGRTLGVTVVAGVQRPRHVPLLAFDQAAHLFFFKNPDAQIIKRIDELVTGLDSNLVREEIISLDFHEVLYANPHTGQLLRTQVDL